MFGGWAQSRTTAPARGIAVDMRAEGSLSQQNDNVRPSNIEKAVGCFGGQITEITFHTRAVAADQNEAISVGMKYAGECRADGPRATDHSDDRVARTGSDGHASSGLNIAPHDCGGQRISVRQRDAAGNVANDCQPATRSRRRERTEPDDSRTAPSGDHDGCEHVEPSLGPDHPFRQPVDAKDLASRRTRPKPDLARYDYRKGL
jgi:hypothetical protein